jgi:hypothetical protein
MLRKKYLIYNWGINEEILINIIAYCNCSMQQ